MFLAAGNTDPPLCRLSRVYRISFSNILICANADGFSDVHRDVWCLHIYEDIRAIQSATVELNVRARLSSTTSSYFV